MFSRPRRSPKELLSRLATQERELQQIESKNHEIAAKTREAAKASLRLGDGRGYQKAALRYLISSREAQVAGGMIELVQGLHEGVQVQRGLERIVAIGRDLGHVQREMGFDPGRVKRIMDHLESGIDAVNQAAVSIASTLKGVSWGETTEKELKEFHEELLAELEAEATTKGRVKQELYSEKKTAAERPSS